MPKRLVRFLLAVAIILILSGLIIDSLTTGVSARDVVTALAGIAVTSVLLVLVGRHPEWGRDHQGSRLVASQVVFLGTAGSGIYLFVTGSSREARWGGATVLLAAVLVNALVLLGALSYRRNQQRDGGR